MAEDNNALVNGAQMRDNIWEFACFISRYTFPMNLRAEIIGHAYDARLMVTGRVVLEWYHGRDQG